MKRTANCLTKLERMNKALNHQEPDRVPISDFFWGGFLKRWKKGHFSKNRESSLQI